MRKSIGSRLVQWLITETEREAEAYKPLYEEDVLIARQQLRPRRPR